MTTMSYKIESLDPVDNERWWGLKTFLSKTEAITDLKERRKRDPARTFRLLQITTRVLLIPPA